MISLRLPGFFDSPNRAAVIRPQQQILSGLSAAKRRKYNRPSRRRRAAPAYRLGHEIGIITALRLLYHVRKAAWYNRPSWRQRAVPAYRLGHKIGIITALRLLYHVREAAWYNRPSWRQRAAPAYRLDHKIGIIAHQKAVAA